ncbi:MAG: arginyltransferase [Deltaproteobacteria bacterium]|nr:arginyltransferase [Deltaproteobacteria bacterium]
MAVLPMRLPLLPLDAEQFDRCLAAGDRRQGILLYRPQCPNCTACEPIRLDVQTFAPDRTQRRVLRVGQARLTMRLGRPVVDAERVALYNLHKHARGLDHGEGTVTAADYAGFLAETCVDTFELSYWDGERLVGVAIVDRAAHSLSAVYCCYDPRVAGVSIGVFSVMTQVELCKAWGLRWLYLGFYVAGCRAMRYKGRYGPHQRLVDGRWATRPRAVAA